MPEGAVRLGGVPLSAAAREGALQLWRAASTYTGGACISRIEKSVKLKVLGFAVQVVESTLWLGGLLPSRTGADSYSALCQLVQVVKHRPEVSGVGFWVDNHLDSNVLSGLQNGIRMVSEWYQNGLTRLGHLFSGKFERSESA